MKTPKFQDAHRGCLFLLQSAHVLLPSSFTRFLSVVRFCSARSAAGLGRRDIVGQRSYVQAVVGGLVGETGREAM